MPQVPKPASILKLDNSPKLSKEEIRMREKYEQSLLTGERMVMSPAVKADPIASKIFKRTVKLLEKIEKNDALYENSVNRYVLLLAEQEHLTNRKTTLEQSLESLYTSLNDASDEGDLEKVASIGRAVGDLQKTITAIDRSLNTKRNQSFALEKENLMTVASSLRAIPKRKKDMPPEDKQTPFMRMFGSKIDKTQ